MLSRVLPLFVLISCAKCLVANSSDVIPPSVINRAIIECDGSVLSVFGNADLSAKLAQLGWLYKYCTYIRNDLFIANLTSQQLPEYMFQRVRWINGSIIVLNNRHVSRLHFPSLEVITATSNVPAIAILNNTDIDFEIGKCFRAAFTSYRITFAVVKNRGVILDKDQYNLWHFAGWGVGMFLVDSNMRTDVCLENFFKPIAGCLGFLFVALTVAFSTVAFYDRPRKQKDNEKE